MKTFAQFLTALATALTAVAELYKEYNRQQEKKLSTTSNEKKDE